MPGRLRGALEARCGRSDRGHRAGVCLGAARSRNVGTRPAGEERTARLVGPHQGDTHTSTPGSGRRRRVTGTRRFDRLDRDR